MAAFPKVGLLISESCLLNFDITGSTIDQVSFEDKCSMQPWQAKEFLNAIINEKRISSIIFKNIVAIRMRSTQVVGGQLHEHSIIEIPKSLKFDEFSKIIDDDPYKNNLDWAKNIEDIISQIPR